MQYKIINRISRKSQVMNNNELRRFLKLNNFNDYAISAIKSNKENVLDTLFISFISICVVILISELILLWIK
tara:strand:+ start:10436 stop:10651 length:216 start_codon:yes stop_codon:yes gene_type:complete